MMGRRRAGGWIAVALFTCFCGGVLAGWILRAGAPEPANLEPANPESANLEPANVEPANPRSAIDILRQHDLRVPIDGVTVESMRGGFDERRDAGGRPHEAVDMLAPRNTPVHAVDGGTIAKLFFSKAGGNTIYQFDPSGRFCYYYAHLERYAVGLRDGAPITRGDVIAFVGTSGNAPANTPHLHFAIFELTPERHWWQGQPLDPYLAFHR
jgi:peptidoglycan LD-endopeptidase LytH